MFLLNMWWHSQVFCTFGRCVFISGLYEKHTLIFKSRIPTVIFNAQLVNVGLAVLYFYLVTGSELPPKQHFLFSW